MLGVIMWWKRDEIGSMFDECKLDILGLSESKLRGEGELSFGGVRCFKSGVGRRTARERVAVLMNECVWLCVREIRKINSRIMYASICKKMEFWIDSCVCPRNGEFSGGERSFWEELKRRIEVCEDSESSGNWRYECPSR